MTVDPDKLTDINLLKRHVLKRCIYGVDLNPMAVELAKVSLWLDAFTLGAPLSFLDHHLRCGNSLVGATFKDLEEATSGRLFHLDYEPMLRAINYVLMVSKDADATAAEVAQSVSRYDQARRDLSGYQVVLDLLVARHFGLPLAQELVTQGSDLYLADSEHFLKSLHDDKERRLVAAGRGSGPPSRPALLPLGDRVPRGLLRPDGRHCAAAPAQGQDGAGLGGVRCRRGEPAVCPPGDDQAATRRS